MLPYVEISKSAEKLEYAGELTTQLLKLPELKYDTLTPYKLAQIPVHVVTGNIVRFNKAANETFLPVPAARNAIYSIHHGGDPIFYSLTLSYLDEEIELIVHQAALSLIKRICQVYLLEQTLGRRPEALDGEFEKNGAYIGPPLHMGDYTPSANVTNLSRLVNCTGSLTLGGPHKYDLSGLRGVGGVLTLNEAATGLPENLETVFRVVLRSTSNPFILNYIPDLKGYLELGDVVLRSADSHGTVAFTYVASGMGESYKKVVLDANFKKGLEELWELDVTECLNRLGKVKFGYQKAILKYRLTFG